MDASSTIDGDGFGRAGLARSRLWQPKAETALYRMIAAGAARSLSRLGFVRSVYARRSVACGEVVLGRSDVDLHVLIHPFEDPREEGRALAALAKRIRRLRRLLPILGDFDVSTPADLDHWYRSRPSSWHRDRGWLRLWGEPYERPEPPPDDRALRESSVRWFLMSADRLPELIRLSSAHHCANVAADLLHAYYLICGGLDGRGRRADILERWHRDDVADARRAWLAAGYARAFRGGARGVEDLAQSLALELGDALSAALNVNQAPAPPPRDLVTRPPSGLEQRRYLLVDPSSAEQLARARHELLRDRRVVVTTLASLALRLRFFRPWDWDALAWANGSLSLPRPRDADYLAAVRSSLHKELLRRPGLAPEGSLAAELHLARCKQYLDEGRIAASGDELAEVYASIYGNPPVPPSSSIDEYFATRYPTSVRLIDTLSADPRLR